ncbi:MAG: hypothetical protein QOE70_1623 [Chthoniobacter sp.]|nr:hypothetical protein [Chthoniobacter sp.]
MNACLIFHNSEGEDARYDLIGGPITIGRHPDNGIQVADSSVSGHHAELAVVNSGFRFTDTGSSNGSWVNGESVTWIDLQNGDRIRLGNVEATYSISDNCRSEIEIRSGREIKAETKQGLRKPLRNRLKLAQHLRLGAVVAFLISVVFAIFVFRSRNAPSSPPLNTSPSTSATQREVANRTVTPDKIPRSESTSNTRVVHQAGDPDARLLELKGAYGFTAQDDSATAGWMQNFLREAKSLFYDARSDEEALQAAIDLFEGINALTLREATSILSNLNSTRRVTNIAPPDFLKALRRIYPTFRREMPLTIAARETAESIMRGNIATELQRRSKSERK